MDRIDKHSPSLVATTNTVPPGDLSESYRISSVAGLLADTVADLHRRW